MKQTCSHPADQFVKTESGSQYEVNVGSMHRQTSWWMVETMTGVRQETRHLGGKDRVGCEGFGLVK